MMKQMPPLSEERIGVRVNSEILKDETRVPIPVVAALWSRCRYQKFDLGGAQRAADPENS